MSNPSLPPQPGLRIRQPRAASIQMSGRKPAASKSAAIEPATIEPATISQRLRHRIRLARCLVAPLLMVPLPGLAQLAESTEANRNASAATPAVTTAGSGWVAGAVLDASVTVAASPSAIATRASAWGTVTSWRAALWAAI